MRHHLVLWYVLSTNYINKKFDRKLMDNFFLPSLDQKEDRQSFLPCTESPSQVAGRCDQYINYNGWCNHQCKEQKLLDNYRALLVSRGEEVESCDSGSICPERGNAILTNFSVSLILKLFLYYFSESHWPIHCDETAICIAKFRAT